MKVINVIGHPITVISLFLLLLISGESFGGFYLLYILLGLSHGAPAALLAVVGIASGIAGNSVSANRYKWFTPLLYVAAMVLMLFSLAVFFKNSKGYNDQTFEQIVPLISFALFGVSLLANLFLSIALFIKRSKRPDNKMSVVS